MPLNTYKVMIKLTEFYRFLYTQTLQVCYHSVNFIHYSSVAFVFCIDSMLSTV